MSNDQQEAKSEVSDDENWEDWNDSVQGGDGEPTRSLFCDKVLSSPEEAMQHDAEHYGFDVRQYAVQERLDEYDIFRCINFMRRQLLDGTDPLASLNEGGASSKWRGNDDYLKPVLEDDALLFFDYESVVCSWRSAQPAASGSNNAAEPSAAEELQRLRDENEALREALAMLATSCMPEELKEERARDGAAATSLAADGKLPSGSAEPGPSSAPSEEPAQADSSMPAPLSASARAVDCSYFDSYGGFGIHQDMISDKPRTQAYQTALEGNPSLIKGKTVLDVGCGSGILSLFACRAGAARVVSVEGNQRMANFATQICKDNGYSSEDGGPMTVLHGKLEELGELPVDKVDVLVSEWMGYALLFETMLDTVLYARDRFLKPGGAVLPDIASIYIAGAASGACCSSFWRKVYGFDMSAIANEALKGEKEVAHVHIVKSENVVTGTVKIKELDLCTMTADQQDFSEEFTLVAEAAASSSGEAGSAAPRECHAIVMWFDTDFSARHCTEASARLSTSVHEPPTHWSQVVMVLKEPVMLMAPGQVQSTGSPPSAEKMTGRVSMVRNKTKHRFLDISLEYKAQLSDGTLVDHTSLYSMSVSTSI